MEKLIITVALGGAEVARKFNPNVPTTAEQLAQAAYDAYCAGASIIHLHVYDDVGQPTEDLGIFQRAVDLIHEKCPLIIEGSTGGGRTDFSPEQRSRSIEARGVELGTLNMGSVNFFGRPFINAPQDLEFWAKKMRRLGVKPTLMIFEVGMVRTVERMVEAGLLDPPLYFDLVMNAEGAIPGTPKNLLHLVECLPSGSQWSVNAFTPESQLCMTTMAILMGGHVRVGFEDNIYYTPGVLAPNNTVFVERIVRFAEEVGRDVASPDEARTILLVAARPGHAKGTVQREGE